MKNKSRDSKLDMKKATLRAWAKILLSEGMIDVERCNKMIILINKIAA